MEKLRKMTHNLARKAIGLRNAISALETLQSNYRPIFDDDPVVIAALMLMTEEYEQIRDELKTREKGERVLEDVFFGE